VGFAGAPTPPVEPGSEMPKIGEKSGKHTRKPAKTCQKTCHEPAKTCHGKSALVL
jgi:hypothetical protein